MTFCTFTLIDDSPDPITGVRLSTAERFQAVVKQARFTSVEDFLETGSVLVGSPEQIIDKFGRYQAAFGHELTGIATEVPGLPDDLNRESVERFVGDVVPVLRAAHPSRLWAS